MMNNIYFLFACLVLAGLAWIAFQFLGQYAFIVMLTITIVGLLVKIGKPKFDKKNS